MSISISRSRLDEQRFNLRVARALNVTSPDLPEVISFCQREQVQLLIARCSVHEQDAVHAMELAGFLLMDTLIYYARDLAVDIPALPEMILVRQAQSSDEQAVAHIAVQAFRGYNGHYHADPRLDRAACDEAYMDWAVRSCRRQAADELLLVERNHRLMGFLSLKARLPQEVDGLLFAVSPDAQGQGVGRALMIAALHWCRRQGAQRMIISTQITNHASQAIWNHLGFFPYQAFYTFHKWFKDKL